MTDIFRDPMPAEEYEPCLPAVEFAPTDCPPRISDHDEGSCAAWCERWAPRCPDGNRQVVRRAEGFRERNPCELELRVLLGCGFDVACQVVVDERPTEVHVRVLLCAPEDRFFATRNDRHYTECPVRVWLEDRLGDRAVIDIDTDKELDEYRPRIVGTSRQPDGGYHPSNRRA